MHSTGEFGRNARSGKEKRKILRACGVKSHFSDAVISKLRLA